jgi:predicted MFS family arabinose efflux permease
VIVEAQDAGKQRGLLLALGVCTFVVGLDGRIVAPLLPSIARELGVPLATAGYTVSFYLLPYGLCQLAYGPLADRFGKLRVAATTMLVFSVGTALCGAFDGLGALLALRALTGAAAAALIPLTIAYIGDTVPYARRQATLGLLMASSGAAQGLSTSLGGLMAEVISWRSMFPLLGCASGAVTWWLWRASRSALDGSGPAATGGYRAALASPLLPLLGLVFVEGALFMGCFPFLSGLLEARFGSGPLEIGLLLGVAGVSQLAIAKALPLLIAQLGEERLIGLGSSLMASAYLLSALAPSVLWVAGGVAALGTGFSLCHSTLQARATEVFPEGRGRSLSLFAFSLFVGGGLGTFAMGALSERIGYGASFAAAGVAFVLFGLVAARKVDGSSSRICAPEQGVPSGAQSSTALIAVPPRH